jgi:hypothetical protein
MSNQSRHSFWTVRTNRSAMGRAAGHVHAAATDFNEEQHIQPLEPDGIDAKEVDGNHAVSLALEELPATTYRAACRPDRAGAFATPFSPSSPTRSSQGSSVHLRCVDTPSAGFHAPGERSGLELHGRPERRAYLHRFATKRRSQSRSVVGVTTNDDYLVRGSNRLAAAKKTRSAGWSSGRRT